MYKLIFHMNLANTRLKLFGNIIYEPTNSDSYIF